MVIENLRVRKERKTGVINVVDITSNSGSSFHQSGGYSALTKLTDAQAKRYIGTTGGVDIKHGAGKYFIEIVFMPLAEGDDKNKALIVKKILGI